MDREHPERALVELTFDNDAFLATQDGGNSWATLGPGLKRTETRHVYATPSGWYGRDASTRNPPPGRGPRR